MSPTAIILSPLRNATALTVAWGLRANGVRVLCGPALGDSMFGSLSIAAGRDEWAIEAAFSGAAVRSVWCHRPQAPAPPAGVAPAEAASIASEWQQFESDVCALSQHGMEALWVNEPQRAREAENRLLQLRVARRLGIAFPDTLASNDPARVRDFIARHGRVLGRGFRARAETGAHADGPALLPDPGAVHATAEARCPRLYQRWVDKQCDVRVAVVGNRQFAMRLDEPRGAGERAALSRSAASSAQPYDLPAGYQASLAALMRELGIVHGRVDLLLDARGELQFLGVEPRKHGLAIEERVPQLPVLKALCAMLAQGRADYSLDLAADISLAQWRECGGGPQQVAPHLGGFVAPGAAAPA